MKLIRGIAVFTVLWAIITVFSPGDTAWNWFMSDLPKPTDLGGLIMFRDEWHSALFKTRLIAVALFVGASFVGAWAHAAIEFASVGRSSHYA